MKGTGAAIGITAGDVQRADRSIGRHPQTAGVEHIIKADVVPILEDIARLQRQTRI
jgi:hypothetical protein